MDLLCHENLIENDHHKLFHKQQQQQQDDDYMSSNSNSSSYSPVSLSQYSTVSSSYSSGIGSSTCQSPPTSSGHFSSLHEDSNFGDLSSSRSSSFATFRDTVSHHHVEAPAIVQETVPQVVTTTTRAAKRSAPQQEIHYNHIPKIRKADRDPVFLENRCLANLFALEEQLYASSRGRMRGNINDQMRRIVASWMMELCEGRACQEEVCLLALNYMDRYLIVCEVKKNHLQLLAAACLLLASKLREPSCTSLTADILVYFTDNSITKTDLTQWELLVLSALKWDISVVTPLDFLEHFLSRLAIRDLDVNKVRLHAQAFICLAAQEHFLEKSSTIAAASIAVSINGLHCRESGEDAGLLIVNRLVDKSVSMGKLAQDSLIECMNRMESIYEEQKSKLVPEYILNTPPNSPVNGKDGAGQVVPATPQKCPQVDGDGSESEGDIKF